MPGWRVGFCCGNRHLLAALARIKSYFDYGLFTPIQVAAIKALDEGDESVNNIKNIYESRRNALVRGLNNAGWSVEKPKATMFVWAPIPSQLSMTMVVNTILLLSLPNPLKSSLTEHLLM